MGYVTTGAEGTVVSLGSTNFYSDLLSRWTPMSARLRIESESHDITGMDVESAVKLAGLYSWTVEISGMAHATPQIGNVGSVAFSAGGYALHVRSYNLNIQAREIDITELTGPPQGTGVSRVWRPDGPIEISGDIETMADSSTSPVLPAHVANPSSLPTVTLGYGDFGTDNTIAGGAQLTALDVSVAKGQENTYDYSFVGSGAWTPAGTTNPLGGTALGIPLWNAGGSVVGPIVIATLTGTKTFTGADSFWTRLGIRTAVGSPIELNATLRGTGAITIA